MRRSRPSIRSSVRVIIDSLSGFFQRFVPEKPGGSVPDPERPDGSSPALPTTFHEGRTHSRCVSRLRVEHRSSETDSESGTPPYRVRRTFWSRCALHPDRFLMSAAWLRSSLTAASTRAGLPIAGWLPHVFAASTGGLKPRQAAFSSQRASHVRLVVGLRGSSERHTASRKSTA